MEALLAYQSDESDSESPSIPGDCKSLKRVREEELSVSHTDTRHYKSSDKQSSSPQTVGVSPGNMPSGTASGLAPRPRRIEGKYPVVVLLQVRMTEAMRSSIREVYQQVQTIIPELRPLSDLAACDCHVSLSHTVFVHFDQIDVLRAAVEDCLQPFKSFPMGLGALAPFVNHDKSRTFVALLAARGREQVVSLVRAVDRAFVVQDLDPFFKVPRPHVSIGWVSGEHEDELTQLLTQLPGPQPALQCQADAAVMHVGQRVYKVWERSVGSTQAGGRS